MEKTIFLTHSLEKLKKALEIGFSDYGKRYDDDCVARKFKCRFSDKFGKGVYAWYDPTGTALENFTPIYVWVDKN